MEIKEFIESLERSNFSLAVENEKLVLQADRKKLSKKEIDTIKTNEFVISFIKANKEALVGYLSAQPEKTAEKVSKNIAAVYKLSGLQQGMLFHGLYEQGSGAYIGQLSCDVTGMDTAVFRQSWNEVLKRHSILRSAFFYDSFSVPVQSVYREVEMPIEELDYRHLAPEEQAEALKKYEEADRIKGFDFKQAPLMRISLLRTGDAVHHMIWASHHILLDGWSLQIIIEEFLTTYQLLSAGKPAPQVQEDKFEDYIRHIERSDKEQEEKYWRQYLRDVEESTLLPFIEKTAVRTKGVGVYKSLVLELDAATTATIQAYVQKQRLTVNTLMQGVWSLLLHCYSGKSDATYGVIVAGRPESLTNVEHRVGLYINTLPLHSKFEASKDVAAWLQELQNQQVLSRRYQHTPLSDVQEWTEVKGDLFDTILVFENYPVSKMIAAGNWSLSIDNVDIREQSNYPLSIEISSADRIAVKFIYNTVLLDEFYMLEIRDHFEHVLLQIAAGEQISLGDIKVLSPSKENLLADFNNTAQPFPVDKSVVDLFEEQVLNTPDNIALVSGQEKLSYHELDARSNQLAAYLQKLGVRKESLVPVSMKRSVGLIVSMLGIMKAGGAYVPVDPAYPSERKNFMLGDTGATLIITTNEGPLKIPGSESNVRVLELDTEWSDINKESTNRTNSIQPNQLAYVIYTSGSTGLPKGVLVEHKGLVNLCYWHNDAYEVTEKSKATAMAGIGFDALGWEVWPYLLKGASVSIIDDNLRLNTAELVQYFKSSGITHSFISTGALPEFVQETKQHSLNSLKYLLTGGDKLNLLNKEGISYELVNNYGPTESTVVATFYRLPVREKYLIPPIGKPISNTIIYILNERLQLVPPGVPGEICIGGASLARGYLNQPDLTTQKFISNPFVKGGQERIYKTGDTGRWLPDGNIEYLGRIDAQVKVRGYRIEPGEIERALVHSGLVSQAVVVAADKEGIKRLIAYVVQPEYGQMFDSTALVNKLREQLPDYMIPLVWVALERLPLTANGKVDRKALPAPREDVSGFENYIPPRNEQENKFVNIWQELLGLSRVGIEDNFFELGGHSLLAMRLVSALRRTYNIEVSVKDIFEYPTVAALSAHISLGDSAVLLSPIRAIAPRPEKIPLSFSQERLWFIDRLEGSVQYHVPSVLRLRGPLDIAALEQALRGVVRRHEALRTVIAEEEGQAFQQVQPGEGWQLSQERKTGESLEALRQYIETLIREPFDLARDYLLRATLLEQQPGDYLLVATLHHIASDGWSRSILVRELAVLYSACEQGRETALPALPVQYADYALWQRGYLQGRLLEEKLAYWKERLGDAAVLQLPGDGSRSGERSGRGGWKSFEIEKGLTGRLQALGTGEGVTLFMVLVSAFKVLLSRYSGQQDICVGTPVAGRQQQEVEGLIGFFVNTLVLRSTVDPEATFGELLGQVKAVTLGAYGHQEVPFEKVVEAMVRERDGGSPLFRVMFVLQNTPEVPELKLGSAELTVESYGHSTAMFDLTVYVTQTGQGLHCAVEYATDIFSEAAAERLCGHYQRLLQSVAATGSLQQPMGRLAMLSAAEERVLQEDYSGATAKISYDTGVTLTGLFARQAARTPGDVALIDAEREITYQELAERSGRLAVYLQGRGVRPGTLVPVCLERGAGLVTAILGILQAGGTYVPIDPQYPAARISYMLDDTQATLAVTQRSLAPLFAGWPPTSEGLIFAGSDEDYDKEEAALPAALLPGNAAEVCLIYTSGSTGRPKGVRLSNNGIINRLHWMWTAYPFTQEERSALKTSAGFVDHLWELFGPLLAGIPSVVLSSTDTAGLDTYINRLYHSGITRLVVVPTLLRTLLEHAQHQGAAAIEKLQGIKYWSSSGEALGAEVARLFYRLFPAGDNRLLNIYGSSEVSADVTCYDTLGKALPYKGNVPVGRPLPGCRVYISDRQGNLLPAGAAGEICVGGIQVSSGYLHQPALTAQKFTSDPYSTDPGARLYHTGDTGRWDSEGNLEYLGRSDEQVKIRGNRVELGEIEQAARESGLAGDVAVTAVQREGESLLIGYATGRDGYLDRAGLLHYLQEHLAAYMVPGVWIQVETMPLTAGGKTDKLRLPAVGQEDLKVGEYEAPGSETEEVVARVWGSYLGVERIGMGDNFFELGGHSLLALRVVAAIGRELGVALGIKGLFEHPRAGAYAGYVQGELGQAEKSKPESIGRQERPPRIPLSFSQERLWFIDRLEGSVQYHLGAVLRLQGNLDVVALEQALGGIVARHEVLRTVYGEDGGHSYQQVKPAGQWRLDKTAYRGDPEGLKSHTTQLIRQPFDLSADYMLRAALLRLDTDEHLLVVTLHHIAADAWSLPVIIKETAVLYDSYMQGREAALPVLPLQYADYAIWQRSPRQEALLEARIGYWKDKLRATAPLHLPLDYARPVVAGSRGASAGYTIDKELTARLHRLGQQQGTTLFMTLLAAFKVLLHRYSGQEDICVGTSVANRGQQETEGLAGFFVNTLALRDTISPAQPFTALLQQVKETTTEAYAHQEVPFEKVVEAVVRERDPGRSPLFQVMLVLATPPEAARLQLGEVRLTTEPYAAEVSKFEITFFITETPAGLSGHIEYRSDLYQAGTISRMAVHYLELLRSVTVTPQEQIARLRMLPREEEQQLLQYGEATVAYPREEGWAALFEAQAAKTPAQQAVVFGGESLTYGELNLRANRLAHYLRSKGAGKGQLIPLFTERGLDMVVGITGILKAGGAYVPLDTGFPAARLAYMLQDTAATLVVSSREARSRLPATAATVVETDGEELLQGDLPTDNPAPVASAGDPVYVIYTSGSTGLPKGVLVSQGSLADYVYGLEEKIQPSRCRSFALVSTIATDLGNTVLYGSLLSGGTLHVFTRDQVSDSDYLHRYFRREQIDCLKIVPSHWQALSAGDRLLLPRRLLVFGGEALQTETAAKIRLSGAACRVVNHYGPTETTIGKLLHEVREDYAYGSTIPVGRPFSNTSVYVLNSALQLNPAGVPGQLYIAGAGLAAGYLNNAALTKEKFISNPFRPGTRMYATGDQVKYLPDGNIVFIGRADGQVKIRGYRIEPGEIERALVHSGLVSQAVVVAADKEGVKRLIGYVVQPEYGQTFDSTALVNRLREQLPDYMIPQVWVALERLPLTANGKVDRQALPDPETSGSAQEEYVAPRTETERTLAALWQDILETSGEVSIHDDFFVLGGHSLLAIRVVSAIRKALQAELPVSDIFDYPTVALLAGRLEAAAAQTTTAVLLPPVRAVVPRPEKIPLSFSQERLWFIDRLEGSVQYHVPSVLRLRGPLDIAALEQALRGVVRRHEALRTVIAEEEGQAFQQVQPGEGWQLSQERKTGESPAALQQYIETLIREPFDLARDYLLRATLLEQQPGDYLLVATLHHIASDGWSRSILVRELAVLYSACEQGRETALPALPVQYADYALWQRGYLQGRLLEEKLAYWKERLGDAAVLQLPGDGSRSGERSGRGGWKSFEIEKGLTGRLQALGTGEGVTLFMVLVSAFKVLLSRYSGQQDICVGTPVAGRQQQEVEGLIGFFVNTLVLRSTVNPEATFGELLGQVKAVTLGAYGHQEVPFEKVVEAVVRERDGGSPLFRVMFVLRNTPEVPELKLGSAELTVESYGHSTAMFDLTVYVTQTGQGLHCAVEYATDIFEEAAAERLCGHYQRLLQSVAATGSLQQPMGRLAMLAAAEERVLLKDYSGATQKSGYDTRETLTGLFARQAARTPGSVALVDGKREITYQELAERSGRLAVYLQGRGVRPGTLVPVCLERGAGLVTAILGILQAGGTYVPIDPQYPAARISYMLQDTQATLIISSKRSKHLLPEFLKAEILETDTLLSGDTNLRTTPLHVEIPDDNLAYIIYTSGSTGTPKGVMMPGKNLVNLLLWQEEQFENRNRKVLQYASLNFDVSFQEIFSTLCFGSTLYLIDESSRKDMAELLRYINKCRITHLFVPYIVLKTLTEHISETNGSISLEEIITAGEQLKLTEDIKQLIKKTGIKLINQYGPTEAHVVTSYTVTPGSPSLPPIGKPVSNTQIYILDSSRNLCPLGVTGEIAIGGAQVAKGYLNQPGLSAEKFVNDPFAEVEGQTMYLTGDLGRWLPDSNMEYLGRKDDQVKVRGYRVELGEIENALLASENIKQAVVLAKDDQNGSNRLVGYIVANGAFNKNALTSYLLTKLPSYMIPALWIEMEALPVTQNGKVDRRILDGLDIGEVVSKEHIPPGTETQIALAGIWQSLLRTESIGITDNFFELGGHSLMVVRLVANIKKAFLISVPVAAIFQFPTISELSNYIDWETGASQEEDTNEFEVINL